MTNERVLILSGGFRPSVLSLRLATIPAVELRETRAGVGTISFGSVSGIVAVLGEMQGWPGAGRHAVPQLELVPAARSVYETIQAAQRDALPR